MGMRGRGEGTGLVECCEGEEEGRQQVELSMAEKTRGTKLE